MKTEPLFKNILIGLCALSIFIVLLFSFCCHRFEETVYTLLILSVCFITTLACQLLWAKWEAERALKQGEFDRKQHIKQLERQIEELQNKQHYPKTKEQISLSKELLALLKDYKGDNLANFQKFIEWTKNQ